MCAKCFVLAKKRNDSSNLGLPKIEYDSSNMKRREYHFRYPSSNIISEIFYSQFSMQK